MKKRVISKQKSEKVSSEINPQNIRRCKQVLEEFFRDERVPICSANSRSYIDGYVAAYLSKNGFNNFLVNDVTMGLRVGGVSERALIDLARSGRIFKGVAGTYRIQETYGNHSVRLFEAWAT